MFGSMWVKSTTVFCREAVDSKKPDVCAYSVFYCNFLSSCVAEYIVTIIWDVTPPALFHWHMNHCLKPTDTVRCSDILLNSVHLSHLHLVPLPSILPWHDSFFAIPFTPVLPPSLLKWLRTSQYLIPCHKRIFSFRAVGTELWQMPGCKAARPQC